MTAEQALRVFYPGTPLPPKTIQWQAFEVLNDVITETRIMLRYDTHIHEFEEMRRYAAAGLKDMLIEDESLSDSTEAEGELTITKERKDKRPD